MLFLETSQTDLEGPKIVQSFMESELGRSSHPFLSIAVEHYILDRSVLVFMPNLEMNRNAGWEFFNLDSTISVADSCVGMIEHKYKSTHSRIDAAINSARGFLREFGLNIQGLSRR